jgi:phage minor structural protein
MFLFNRNQKVKRWLVDRDFIEAKMTEEINAASKLVFSVPLKKRLPPSYFFAAVPQPRGSDYFLFKIISEQVQSDRVQYTCVEAAYDELKSYHYIKDDRPQNRSAADMLRMALDGTRWGIGTTYDAGAGSTNFYYISSLEAIQKIVNLFQLEVVFSIVLDPHSHQITRRLVNLYSQQGQRTGKRFEYGSNLLSVEREESSENLITALIGRGKGEEIYHDNSNGEATEEDKTPDGYGRRINFANVVWSKTNGNPVDKPAGQEYVEDPDATAAYGFDDGKPRIGIEIFEDITDPAELLQATWSALQTLKRPRVSFKANVMDVGDLGLGDTVAIIRHDIKIEYFTRVYKVEHNLLNERLNTIELGDDFNSESITSAVNSITTVVQQANQTANYAASSANGKNTNYYGKDKPLLGVEGDLWYKDLGNGEVDMYQFHDGNWIMITSTRDLHNVQKQVDEQNDQMKQFDADNKKRDEEMQKLISDTRNELNSAKADATATNKRLDGVAAQAQQNGVGITDLTKQLGQIQTTVADTKGDVTQLTQRADKAEADMKDASGKLNQLEITTNGLEQITTNQDDQINQFRIDINGLKDSVSDSTGKISLIQNDLTGLKTTVASKASVSYVDQKSNEWSVNLKKLSDQTTDLRNEVGWQTMTSAIDANNLTKTGNYWLQNTPNAHTPDSGAWAFLKVVAEWNNKRIVQTWQRDNRSYEQYTRVYTESGWSDWQQTITNGTIIAQINVAAGTTLIQNDRIYMDASSTVFSGSAFIPSAAITDLSADKITTGTLNAGNVNIINMNANNITTGTIKGQNLSINLNSGEMFFQRGRITSFFNTLDINIDDGTMSVTDAQQEGVYFSQGQLMLSNNFGTSPKYGGIRKSGKLWSSGVFGFELHGAEGVSIISDNYDGGLEGTFLDVTNAGAGVIVSKDGNATVNASNITRIMGGSQYLPAGWMSTVDKRSSITLGTDATGTSKDTRTVIRGSYVHIPDAYYQTGSGSANLIVAEDGALIRATSASKYKTAIVRSHSLDYGERLLSLPTATWLDKAENKRYATGESKDKPVMHFGMIAEDLANAGLDMLVTRGQDGELEGIQYDRIAPALLPVIKNLQDRIEKLEEQINGRESTINSTDQQSAN